MAARTCGQKDSLEVVAVFKIVSPVMHFDGTKPVGAGISVAPA